MPRTKPRRINPICTHEEVLPPIRSIYIDRKGVYRHVCRGKADCIGTRQVGFAAPEVQFWCPSCLETITIPLSATDRMEVWADDTRWGSSYHPHRDHLRLLGDHHGLPLTASVSENGRPCRTCGVPHLQLPKAK